LPDNIEELDDEPCEETYFDVENYLRNNEHRWRPRNSNINVRGAGTSRSTWYRNDTKKRIKSKC
jgi:hypothetical protein